MLWWKLPIFRLLIFFLLGIASSDFIGIQLWNQKYVLLICTIAFFISAFTCFPLLRHSVIPLYLGFFLLGTCSLPFSNSDPSNYFLDEISKSSKKLCLIEKTEKGKSIASVQGFSTDSPFLAFEAYVQIIHSNGRPIWRPGDSVYIIQTFMQIPESMNNWEFDYRGFMARKNIYWNCTYRVEDFKIVSNTRPKGFQFMLERWRSSLIEDLLIKSADKRLSALLAALLWGDKSYLSEDQIVSFRKSGTAHLIALSGMHVGFVFLLIGKILSFIKSTKLYYPLLIFSVCVYAILGGLSSSVFRAALMLSLVLIGRHLGRNPGTVHWYLLAVLCMLVIKPIQFWDVGFQLSCIAVGGILLFFNSFRSMLQRLGIEKPFLRDSLALCFAAQLSTAPLSVYYFHQFQWLFPLGNMLLTPLIGILMVLGICIQLLPFGYLLAIFQIMAMNLRLLIDEIMLEINSFEKFYRENISIDFKMVWLLFMCIILLNLALFKKCSYWRWLHGMALVCLVFQTSQKIDKLQLNVKCDRACWMDGRALICGNGTIVLTNSPLNLEEWNRHIAPYFWKKGLELDRIKWVECHTKGI